FHELHEKTDGCAGLLRHAHRRYTPSMIKKIRVIREIRGRSFCAQFFPRVSCAELCEALRQKPERKLLRVPAPAERRYRPDPLGFPHEVRAAVLGPGLFVMSRGKGTFLAIADGFHPVGRDSLTYEVLLGLISPPVS